MNNKKENGRNDAKGLLPAHIEAENLEKLDRELSTISAEDGLNWTLYKG